MGMIIDELDKKLSNERHKPCPECGEPAQFFDCCGGGMGFTYWDQCKNGHRFNVVPGNEHKSSWQHRSEWYEKENHRLVKSLLRIRDLMIGLDQTTAGRKTINLIDSLNLESGWDGKDSAANSG